MAHQAQRQRSAWLIPIICLLATGALLGISTNLAKLASGAGLPPLAFLAWSMTGAAIILTVLAASRGQMPPVTVRTVEYYTVAAVISVAGPNLIFFSAVRHVGAGFVALTITLPPLLTYVGALLFGMERFEAIRAAGVIFALTGTTVLALQKIAAPGTDFFWVALTLCGPVLLALGNLYRSLRWPEGVSAEALAPGMLVAASVMLLVAGAVPGLSLAVPTDKSLPLLLIFVQTILFAAQNLLLFVLQKRGGPVLLSLLGSVAAVVGVPVAIFLLGESPPEGLGMGAGLIAIGIVLVTIGGSRLAEPEGRSS